MAISNLVVRWVWLTRTGGSYHRTGRRVVGRLLTACGKTAIRRRVLEEVQQDGYRACHRCWPEYERDERFSLTAQGDLHVESLPHLSAMRRA